MSIKGMRLWVFIFLIGLMMSCSSEPTSDIVACVFSGPVIKITESNFYIQNVGDHLRGYINIEKARQFKDDGMGQTCKPYIGSSQEFNFDPKKKPIVIGTMIDMTWMKIEPSDDSPGGIARGIKIIQ